MAGSHRWARGASLFLLLSQRRQRGRDALAAQCAAPLTTVMVKRSTTSKFPIARIKRIMQADEDVGKVAQATPVVICTCYGLTHSEST